MKKLLMVPSVLCQLYMLLELYTYMLHCMMTRPYIINNIIGHNVPLEFFQKLNSKKVQNKMFHSEFFQVFQKDIQNIILITLHNKL